MGEKKVEFTEEQRQLLKLLDFDGAVRCEHRSSGLGCREAAAFAVHCLHCSEMPRVYCAAHMRQTLTAVQFGGMQAWCPRCLHSSWFFGTLFRIEAMG